MSDTAIGRTLQALSAPGSAYARTFDASPMLDLSVGEARYSLPTEVREELGSAVARISDFGYADPAGDAVLRATYLDTIAEGRRDELGVLVTGGGKEAAWLAIRYLLHQRPHGSVLVPQPGWEPYGLWLDAIGRTRVGYDPVAVAADPGALRRIITSASRKPALLVLNYPHNPTGVGVDQPTMDALIGIAVEYGLGVVSDEVYRMFSDQPGLATKVAAFDPDRHVVVDSCSKWLAAAGLRVGFLAAAPQMVRDLTLYRSTYASCTSTVAQRAAHTLIESPAARHWLTAVREQVSASRAALAAALARWEIDVVSAGGLYLWCRVPEARPVAEQDRSGLLARVTGGAGFGAPGFFRLCPARAGLEPTAAAAAVARTLAGDDA
ncbi:pyridoxal phosphate-dependent aminotransferase [Catellatospora sichuanensis]|uniref:pyridoxal phosphate-dependent aminotransferase n=1 Tax=Catellatospora sichuanensis TaxID=1969805 RepID=UPI001182B262|nr:pyridoxal phosphate-dependent aminotransferase [Catellatospora sichuanensis]